MSSVSKKVISFLLAAWLLFFAVGGVYAASNMMMDAHAEHPCPFMGVPGLCNMTPLAHFSEWQKMFTSTAEQLIMLALLLFISLAVVWCVFRYVYALQPRGVPLSRRREREPVFDPLRLALARGIIHPKVF